MLKKNNFDWIEFGFNLSSSMFFLINGIVFIGSISLYTSLIAQTDFLNLNMESKNASHMTKNAVAHVVRIFKDFPPHLDKEIKTEFNIDSTIVDNISDNKFINGLNKTDITIVHFMKKILFSMIDNNYTVINAIYSMLYQIPESAALFISLYGTPLLWFVMFFVNMGLAGIYHLVHFKEYFASCSGGSCGGNMFNYNYGLKNMAVTFLYMFFFAIPMTLFVYPSVTMIYSYLSPLFATLNVAKTGKKYNFIEYVIDMLSYKRQLIMWLISLTLIRVVFMSLGIYNAITCFASIIFLAMFTRIYSQYVPPSCNVA